MTSRPLVATGGRLFQHARTHPALAGSCPATDSAPYCWQGHLPCALERQRSRLCFLQVCVRAPTPTTPPTPPFVPSAFLINSHLRCCGLAGLNFTRSQTRIIVEHLAAHRTVSPLLFTTAPLCPGGRLATAEGNCRRVLREIKTQSKETDSVNRRAQNAHC